MVGGLKVITVLSGHQSEFETLFSQLRNEMRIHEPGCILYSLLKSREDSRKYIVHEQYVDQKALETHQKSSHGAHYFPRMRAILESIEVEYFDGVVS